MPVPPNEVSSAKSTVKVVYDRIRDFADYRRATTVAQRLFNLPTEALVGVFGASVCGALFGAIFHLSDVGTTIATAFALPFALLASASGPMLIYRYVSWLRTRSSRAELLKFLDEEVKRAKNTDGAPTHFVEHLYSLRARLLDETVDTGATKVVTDARRKK